MIISTNNIYIDLTILIITFNYKKNPAPKSGVKIKTNVLTYSVYHLTVKPA